MRTKISAKQLSDQKYQSRKEKLNIEEKIVLHVQIIFVVSFSLLFHSTSLSSERYSQNIDKSRIRKIKSGVIYTVPSFERILL